MIINLCHICYIWHFICNVLLKNKLCNYDDTLMIYNYQKYTKPSCMIHEVLHTG